MSLKKELIEICHQLYSKEFVAATDGNVSVRNNKNFFVTRSGISKGKVTANDIINVDSEFNYKSKFSISTESKLHFYIYEHREDINAVIHAHPIYATAFASSKNKLNYPIFPEVILSLGKIPLCKYATPSTDKLPKSLEPYIDFANVFLLENHGVVTTGKNLLEAYYRLEKLEHYAKTVIIGELLGGLKPLSKKNIKELYSISQEIYKLNIKEKNKFL
ncbi:MAG: class II aldolase family protein [Chlorobiaceae bacterium]|nr:class II aldolase family protein [Chlorobiaceae bacterium]MBA4309324.1 class II aldolase family protein [Chlorobiaceae bacterium]